MGWSIGLGINILERLLVLLKWKKIPLTVLLRGNLYRNVLKYAIHSKQEICS